MKTAEHTPLLEAHFVRVMAGECMLNKKPDTKRMGLDGYYNYAITIYLDFLRKEDIKFGSAGYLWDETGAIELVRSYHSE